MKPFGYLAAAVLLSPVATQPLAPPAWPPGPDLDFPKAEYVLLGDTTVAYDSAKFADGTVITTSGYDLDIQIRQSLEISGTLLIRAYSSAHTPSPPPAVGVGARGNPNFHRGPDAQGDAPAEQNGMDGGTGGRGPTGMTGVKGFDASMITLRLEPGANVSGKLVIQNVGGMGGDGGQGGKGGPGGDGQQGGRCAAYQLGSEPGHGGNGGSGGPGGFGGPGGDGGRGGQILIKAGSKRVEDWIKTAELNASGGEPGKSGAGGEGGDKGQPGYGGRGAQLCAGQVGEFEGKQGQEGLRELTGVSGARRGSNGIVKIF